MAVPGKDMELRLIVRVGVAGQEPDAVSVTVKVAVVDGVPPENVSVPVPAVFAGTLYLTRGATLDVICSQVGLLLATVHPVQFSTVIVSDPPKLPNVSEEWSSPGAPACVSVNT